MISGYLLVLSSWLRLNIRTSPLSRMWICGEKNQRAQRDGINNQSKDFLMQSVCVTEVFTASLDDHRLRLGCDQVTWIIIYVKTKKINKYFLSLTVVSVRLVTHSHITGHWPITTSDIVSTIDITAPTLTNESFHCCLIWQLFYISPLIVWLKSRGKKKPITFFHGGNFPRAQGDFFRLAVWPSHQSKAKLVHILILT